jgi:glycosyltransferase involved in cell wall biosynthesis
MSFQSLSVSIIIPCRNEEKFIGKCLDSIIAQDYPKENLEVFVADGMSDDKTREIVADYCQKYSFIKLLDNPRKFTPFALNIGIKNSSGKIIVRMDAHADYAKDYVSRCIGAMNDSDADNVGGRVMVMPRDNSLASRAIALCLSSFFGAGNAIYKIKIVKKPVEVDTVFCGCYRKEVFDKIGFFDERMIRNQDLEFNLRLCRAGGKIVLFPRIISYYFPKKSLREFAKHNYDDGYWVIYPLSYGLKTFSWRHLLPLLFVLGLLLSLAAGLFAKQILLLFYAAMGSYALVSLFFSLVAALKEKTPGLLFIMPAVFFIRHFFYGLGSLAALGAVIINRNGRNRKNQKKI